MTATDLTLASPAKVDDDVVSRHWLYGGKLVVFEIHPDYFSSRIVDQIIGIVSETMQLWAPQRPYLALQHFTKGKLMTTPYAQQRVQELAAKFPRLSGRVASVTRPACTAQLSQEWLNHLSRTQQPHLPHRIFFDKKEALEWLAEKL